MPNTPKRGKPSLIEILWRQDKEFRENDKLRESMKKRLRKYDKENTAYTIDQAKNMVDDQIELARKKATKAVDDALRRQK